MTDKHAWPTGTHHFRQSRSLVMKSRFFAPPRTKKYFILTVYYASPALPSQRAWSEGRCRQWAAWRVDDSITDTFFTPCDSIIVIIILQPRSQNSIIFSGCGRLADCATAQSVCPSVHCWLGQSANTSSVCPAGSRPSIHHVSTWVVGPPADWEGQWCQRATPSFNIRVQTRRLQPVWMDIENHCLRNHLWRYDDSRWRVGVGSNMWQRGQSSSRSDGRRVLVWYLENVSIQNERKQSNYNICVFKTRTRLRSLLKYIFSSN